MCSLFVQCVLTGMKSVELILLNCVRARYNPVRSITEVLAQTFSATSKEKNKTAAVDSPHFSKLAIKAALTKIVITAMTEKNC